MTDMMLGDGPKAGLQRVSMLEEMLYYVTPRTMKSLLKATNNKPEHYAPVLVKGEWDENEDRALENVLLKAKEMGCVAATEPALDREGEKFSYSVRGVRYIGPQPCEKEDNKAQKCQ